MVDTLTPTQRSERMSRIRSSNTKPELALRKALHRLGLRFTLGGRELPGKPDIVLPRHRIAIFVHGCFWHRHAGCKVATTPKSNTEFWLAKFERNVDRDRTVLGKLRSLGWKVTICWECELANASKAEITAIKIAEALKAKDATYSCSVFSSE